MIQKGLFLIALGFSLCVSTAQANHGSTWSIWARMPHFADGAWVKYPERYADMPACLRQAASYLETPTAGKTLVEVTCLPTDTAISGGKAL
jgi:hypothetical protein